MSFAEDRARDRVREAANAGYLAAWAAAHERLDRADREWEQASREYRDTYRQVADRNPVLDEFGLTTGEVAPLGDREFLRKAHRSGELVGKPAGVEAVAPDHARYGHRRQDAGDDHDEDQFNKGKTAA